MNLKEAYRNESAISSTIFQTEDAKEGPEGVRREAAADRSWQGESRAGRMRRSDR